MVKQSELAFLLCYFQYIPSMRAGTYRFCALQGGKFNHFDSAASIYENQSVLMADEDAEKAHPLFRITQKTGKFSGCGALSPAY